VSGTLVAKLQEKMLLHDNIKMNFDLLGLLYTILTMTTAPKLFSVPDPESLCGDI